MKWLVDKADTSDMTVRFKSKRKNDKTIVYRMVLSKNFRDYLREEQYQGIRFGYDTENDQTILALGLTKDGQGINIIGNKGDIRSWFDITSYIEQYLQEGVEVNFLKDYKVTLRKTTAILEQNEN